MSFNTDSTITLSLLKRFRRLVQAASRLACAVVSVLGILLSGSAYAYAPTHAQIQMTPQGYAKATLDSKEYKCIKKLYYYESRWSHTARNGDHYGIPQGRSIYLKTATPIEQVKWGIAYNKNRYGNSCKALLHFKRWNWH